MPFVYNSLQNRITNRDKEAYTRKQKNRWLNHINAQSTQKLDNRFKDPISDLKCCVKIKLAEYVSYFYH